MVRKLFAVALFIIFTGTIMADDKEPPKLKKPYTERVTLKLYGIGKSGMEFQENKDRMAYRGKTKDGKELYFVNINNKPVAKSQIIDADGATWEVTEDAKRWDGDSGSEGSYRCVVKKIAEPKKKEKQ